MVNFREVCSLSLFGSLQRAVISNKNMWPLIRPDYEKDLREISDRGEMLGRLEEKNRIVKKINSMMMTPELAGLVEFIFGDDEE